MPHLGAVHGVLVENEKKRIFPHCLRLLSSAVYTYGSTRHASIQIATLVNLHRVKDYTSSSLCGYSYRSLAGLDSFDSCRIARGSSIKTLVAHGWQHIFDSKPIWNFKFRAWMTLRRNHAFSVVWSSKNCRTSNDGIRPSFNNLSFKVRKTNIST